MVTIVFCNDSAIVASRDREIAQRELECLKEVYEQRDKQYGGVVMKRYWKLVEVMEVIE